MKKTISFVVAMALSASFVPALSQNAEPHHSTITTYMGGTFGGYFYNLDNSYSIRLPYSIENTFDYGIVFNDRWDIRLSAGFINLKSVRLPHSYRGSFDSYERESETDVLRDYTVGMPLTLDIAWYLSRKSVKPFLLAQFGYQMGLLPAKTVYSYHSVRKGTTYDPQDNDVMEVWTTKSTDFYIQGFVWSFGLGVKIKNHVKIFALASFKGKHANVDGTEVTRYRNLPTGKENLYGYNKSFEDENLMFSLKASVMFDHKKIR